VGYEVCVTLLLPPMEFAVRGIARERREPSQWFPWSAFPLAAFAILFLQVLYFGAMLSTIFVRLVDWRGVRYRIHGPFKIELEEYRPYQTSSGGPPRQSL
jgi:hypothetical protein